MTWRRSPHLRHGGAWGLVWKLRVDSGSYSSEYMEVEFCELRHNGVLGSTHGPGPMLILPTGTHYGLSWSRLSGERLRVTQDLARSASKCSQAAKCRAGKRRPQTGACRNAC